MNAATPAGVVAQLDGICLEELLQRAALQTRVDRKYLIARADLDSVLSDLDPATRVLEIDGTRSFGYESVYFDTPELTSYLTAARSRRRRFKVRTRAYLDSAECYLEVKTRGGRSTTVKDRLEYQFADRAIITPDGRAYIDAVLADAGVPHSGDLVFDRALTTHYRRSTLYIPSSDSRATIDVGLAWVIDQDSHLELPDLAVVETKSGSTPSDVDRLLWAHGHRPTNISKFGTGFAALRDDVPSNKWSRVIRDHFRQPASLTA